MATLKDDWRVRSSVCPAQAGWGVLVPLWPEAGFPVSADYEPVIAWLVSVSAKDSDAGAVHADVTPITAEGSQAGRVILRRPDGTLTAPHDQDFPSEREALEWVAQRHRDPQ